MRVPEQVKRLAIVIAVTDKARALKAAGRNVIGLGAGGLARAVAEDDWRDVEDGHARAGLAPGDDEVEILALGMDRALPVAVGAHLRLHVRQQGPAPVAAVEEHGQLVADAKAAVEYMFSKSK